MFLVSLYRIISPNFHTHIHINTAFYRKTSGRRQGAFKYNSTIWIIGKRWTELWLSNTTLSIHNSPILQCRILDFVFLYERGTVVAQWLSCCTKNCKVAGSIPAGVSGFFIDVKSFRSHYGPEVDSASKRNECQEYFLGAKAAGAQG